MTSPQKFSVQGSAPQPQGNVSCGGHAGVQSAPLGRVSVDREEQLKHQQRARQEHPHHHHHDEGSRRAQLQSQSPAATEETVVESSSSEPFPRARLDPLVGRGRVEVPDEEAEYLRRNVEHLRSQKHRLEDRVQSLEARVQGLEKTKNQYKMLYEQAQKEAKCRSGGEQELFCLHEQLQAVTYLKDALNNENLELLQRLERSQHARGEESKQGACVICMDNLANTVCLPCKHLALCSYCDQQQCIKKCPICRSAVDQKMQIYMP